MGLLSLPALWPSRDDCRLAVTTCFREHVFHETRKWRFDLAWPALLVAVELDGGIFKRMPSHSSVTQITRDMEKINAAVERGWSVLRYSVKDLDERPADVVAQIADVLRMRRAWLDGGRPSPQKPNPQPREGKAVLDPPRRLGAIYG